MAQLDPLNPMIKLALLGHGSFAQPAFDELKKKYEIVEPQDADCLIVANYGHILTQTELNKPKFGAINLHGSILPNYRGSSPIQTAIANGDTKTGVTIIKMDDKVDHGPILGFSETEIEPTDTTESLRAKLGRVAEPLLLSLLEEYFSDKLILAEQDEESATHTHKLSMETTTFTADISAEKLYNYYRAYHEKPGLYINLEGDQIIKIIQASYENGSFKPEIVQRLGKNPLPYSDFLLGYRFPAPFAVDTR